MGKDKDCGGCGVSPKEQEKKMEEMMKHKATPCDCPLKASCTKKVLKDEADVLCKDAETSQEAMMYHLNQHHMWEACKTFRERKTEAEGKLPREW